MTLRAVIWTAVSSEAQAADDKASLEFQLDRARAWCTENDATVVAMLRIPGFSRDYFDFREFAEDLWEEYKSDAGFQLLNLWKTRGYDVFVVWDGSRFGRTQSLHARVIEETTYMGASLQILRTNTRVEFKNQRPFIAIDGFYSATEKDKLRERYDMGMNDRARRGLSTSGGPIMSHLVIQKDGQDALIVDESLRRLWDDLKTVLLRTPRVPYHTLETVLFTEFGHVDPKTGVRHAPYKFHGLLHNPYFWGHSARQYSAHLGSWAYDVSQPIPAPVVLYRNAHTPVYQGEDAELVIGALIARSENRRPPDERRGTWFSRLIICDECLRLHAVEQFKYKSHVSRYSRCATGKNGLARQRGYTCTQRHGVKELAIRKYVDDWLHQILSQDDFPQDLRNDPLVIDHTPALQRDLETAQKQLTRLQIEQSLATSLPVIESYRETIHTVGIRIEALQTQLRAALRDTSESRVAHRQQTAFHELQRIGPDDLWSLPISVINQLLRDLLGPWRIRARDGQLIGRIRYNHRIIE
jgi:DNA invertase Pin-like site-specific DNA recombinase